MPAIPNIARGYCNAGVSCMLPTQRIGKGSANRRDSDTRLIPPSGSKRTCGNANGMRQTPSIANGSARNSENAAQPGAAMKWTSRRTADELVPDRCPDGQVDLGLGNSRKFSHADAAR